MKKTWITVYAKMTPFLFFVIYIREARPRMPLSGNGYPELLKELDSGLKIAGMTTFKVFSGQ